MKKRLSLFVEINNVLNHRDPGDIAAPILHEGSRISLNTRNLSSGSAILSIPTASRAALLSSQFGGEENNSLLPGIASYIGLVEMGATFMESVLPLKKVPVHGSVVALTAGEIDSIEEGSSTIEAVSFSSHRITYSQPISKLLLTQADPSFEKYFIQNVMAGISKKLMDIILGVGARTSTYPQGILYKVTSGLATKIASCLPTHTRIEALVQELSDAGMLTGKLAFCTSGKGRGILRSYQCEPGSGGKYLLEDGKVSEYPCYISNSVSDIAGSDGLGAGLIFANWADLLINQCGVWDVIIDPITKARNNEVVITVVAHFDALGARGSAATAPADETDDDEYTGSFASLAIRTEIGNQG